MKTDIALIQGFQSGNFDDFGLLYERYLDKIFVYILRKVGDREQAEDICSHVWMKAMRDMMKTDKDEDFLFKSWIYRIAHNMIVDYFRVKKEIISDDILETHAIDTDIAWEIDNADTLQRVEWYLQGCKESEKNILLFRLWDEMSYAEIASLVWKSEDACKQVVKRWLEKIRANVVYVFLLFLIL